MQHSVDVGPSSEHTAAVRFWHSTCVDPEGLRERSVEGGIACVFFWTAPTGHLKVSVIVLDSAESVRTPDWKQMLLWGCLGPRKRAESTQHTEPAASHRCTEYSPLITFRHVLWSALLLAHKQRKDDWDLNREGVSEGGGEQTCAAK